MSEAATKKTRSVTPLHYRLVSVSLGEGGEPTHFDVLPVPDGVKDPKRRDQYKRAVRAVLEAAEDGERVKLYNGRQLTVVSYPDPFMFRAEIKEETIRTVQITEG